MIADRRELYNDQVYRYNTRISQVPGALIAPLFGWRAREFFTAETAIGHVPTRTCGRPEVGDVWLVRHGETEWARLGRHTGRTDIPLTATGREQARALGRALAGHDFGLVMTSPLSRASDTAGAGRLRGSGRAGAGPPGMGLRRPRGSADRGDP